MSRSPGPTESGIFARRPLSFVVGVAVGLLIGVLLSLSVDRLEIQFGDDEAQGEAAQVIEQDYWQAVDPAELEDASVNGMVDYLHRRFDDRFSHYFDPEQFADFQDSTAGHFSGIGLAVTGVKGGLRVGEVYEDSPAEDAGIKEGDLIVAVEGESIAGEPAEASTAKIKGPPGTDVAITVVTPGADERELLVKRARVRIPAIQGEIRRVGGRAIGYVDMDTFSQGVHGDLRREVERLAGRGAEGIVLDLRANGGGLLNEAVLSASVFVEDGTIVSTEGRSQPKEVYEAAGDALPERPMAVLIDGDTASAAEILAAALEDYDLATLVGIRTYGKGTFQEVIPLANGGGLNLTVGEYVTSDGTSLAGKGIPPDIRAGDDMGTKPDEALERALSVVAGELP